jgi:hypothetical protein
VALDLWWPYRDQESCPVMTLCAFSRAKTALSAGANVTLVGRETKIRSHSGQPEMTRGE